MKRLISNLHIVWRLSFLILIFLFWNGYAYGNSYKLYSLHQTDTLRIKGIVTNEEGAPIRGVSITVKNKSIGVLTDELGAFEINVEKRDVLLFTFIGYESTEMKATSRLRNIQLKKTSHALDELVVIGYGKRALKDATGSVAAVSEKDFNKGNIVTPENLINGRVAGLTVNTGGEPGSGSTIRIRGGASLDASNDPLIVIDGLPITNNTIGGSRSILSAIDPNDIASFTILKDASATAIYGSRASNGVIIITTKKGGDKLAINLSMQLGFNTLAKKVSVLSADQFRKVVRELANSRNDASLLPLLGNANTDWQDAIYRTGINNGINLSVQGSIAHKLPVRLSLSRSDQEGLRLTDQFQRHNISLSLHPKLFKNSLKIEFNINASFEHNRFSSGEEGNAISFNPTVPIYDTNRNSPFGGFFQYYKLDTIPALNINDLLPLAPFNPVANLLQSQRIADIQRYYGNLKLEYNFPFFKDLSVIVNLGMDKQSSDGFTKIDKRNPLSQSDGRIVGSYSTYTNAQDNYLGDGYLQYSTTIKNKLAIDFSSGLSYQRFSANRYYTNELFDNTVASEPVTNIDPDLILFGLFGRLNLSWNDKYVLTLSYRRDGSSRFSPNTRWGNFPSAAFAWKIKETLFPHAKTISSLKLRLGYGITGQQDVASLAIYIPTYDISLPSAQYQFGSRTIGTITPAYRNEELKWEENTSYNIGLDFGLFENRFTGSIEGFYKISDDLLAYVQIPDGSNFSNQGFQNSGSFLSKGIEFSISGDIIKAKSPKSFSWNANYNLTFIRTEIASLPFNQDQLVGSINRLATTVQIQKVGYTPNSFFVYKQIYDPKGKPIEGAYADLNGDNLISTADNYIYHNRTPDVTMGFLSNMTFYNFYLSFNWRASIGNYLFNAVNATRAQYNNIKGSSTLSNLPSDILSTNFNQMENVFRSDYYLENASFLRLDNVAFGYTFLIKKLVKIPISLGVYASVQNVFVITNYNGLDPEVYSGIDNTIYPRSRTFTIGVNLKL